VGSLSKAAIVKQLKTAGIPFEAGMTVKELTHRLDNWLPGQGWLIRTVKPVSRKPEHPVALVEGRDAIWIPNSRMAKMIASSGLVAVLGRSMEPPKGTTILDVPDNFNSRWPEE